MMTITTSMTANLLVILMVFLVLYATMFTLISLTFGLLAEVVVIASVVTKGAAKSASCGKLFRRDSAVEGRTVQTFLGMSVQTFSDSGRLLWQLFYSLPVSA
jgi:hypothetical protein